MKLHLNPRCHNCADAICDQCDSANRSKCGAFTRYEVQQARDLKRVCLDGVQFHARIYEDIVTEEVMARIDRETGQTNDRHYMAYHLENVSNQG